MNFRKFVPEPRIIEAVQVTKENLDEVAELAMLHKEFSDDLFYAENGTVWYDNGMERVPHVVIGDWLVQTHNQIEIWSNSKFIEANFTEV